MGQVGKEGQTLRPLLVESVHDVAERVMALTLVHPDGEDLSTWEPGAHVDVVLPSGRVRQYSLCGDPDARNSYRIAVLYEPDGRGGSKEIYEGKFAGTTLRIRGPRNHFEFVPAPSYLFLAGGIGITPILAQARAADRAGIPWRMAYGGRSMSSMAFVDEVSELRGGTIDLIAEDERGLLPLDELIAPLDPGTAVYCCGPESMIGAVEQTCLRLGRRPDLHFERFTPPPPTPGAGAGPAAADGFEVELRATGCVLWVPPERTLLDVVRDAIPDALYSCEEGFCGACEVPVLEGVPEHHDTILTEAEQEKGESMMICVGRSQSPRLVLDM